MKMKEFGPPGGGGGRASLAPPLGSANDLRNTNTFIALPLKQLPKLPETSTR